MVGIFSFQELTLHLLKEEMSNVLWQIFIDMIKMYDIVREQDNDMDTGDNQPMDMEPKPRTELMTQHEFEETIRVIVEETQKKLGYGRIKLNDNLSVEVYFSMDHAQRGNIYALLDYYILPGGQLYPEMFIDTFKLIYNALYEHPKMQQLKSDIDNEIHLFSTVSLPDYTFAMNLSKLKIINNQDVYNWYQFRDVLPDSQPATTQLTNLFKDIDRLNHLYYVPDNQLPKITDEFKSAINKQLARLKKIYSVFRKGKAYGKPYELGEITQVYIFKDDDVPAVNLHTNTFNPNFKIEIAASIASYDGRNGYDLNRNEYIDIKNAINDKLEPFGFKIV